MLLKRQGHPPRHGCAVKTSVLAAASSVSAVEMSAARCGLAGMPSAGSSAFRLGG